MDEFVEIFGLPVFCRGRDALTERILTKVGKGEASSVTFLEGNLLSKAQRPSVHRVLKGSSLIVPDGTIVGLACHIRSRRKVQTTPGPDIMERIMIASKAHQWRHVFFGSSPKTVAALKERFSEAGPILALSPSFAIEPSEMAEHLATIRDFNANFVWVGLGGPKQETLVYRYQESIRADWILCVGAAFDFHSGTVRRAPLLVRRIGLEWAFRMFAGGKRVFDRNRAALPVSLVRLLDVMRGTDR